MIILFDCQIFGNMGNFELGLIYIKTIENMQRVILYPSTYGNSKIQTTMENKKNTTSKHCNLCLEEKILVITFLITYIIYQSSFPHADMKTNSFCSIFNHIMAKTN